MANLLVIKKFHSALNNKVCVQTSEFTVKKKIQSYLLDGCCVSDCDGELF